MMTAPHPQHFLHVYPGPFGNEHALQMGGPGNMMMQGAQLLAKAVPIDGSLLTCSSFPNAVDADTGALRQQLQLQAREIHRLQGTFVPTMNVFKKTPNQKFNPRSHPRSFFFRCLLSCRNCISLPLLGCPAASTLPDVQP